MAKTIPGFAQPERLPAPLRDELLALGPHLSPRARAELWRQVQRGEITSVTQFRQQLASADGGQLRWLRGVGETTIEQWRAAVRAVATEDHPMTTTPFDLRAAMKDRARAQREQQAAHDAAREAAAETARQGLINDFRQTVEMRLSPALREQLGELTYQTGQVVYSTQPVATCLLEGVTYTLAPSDHGTKLGIFPYDRSRQLTVLYGAPASGLADTSLIDYLASVHPALVAEVREREQAEQARQARLAAALIVDERCQARLAAARAEAEASRWTWPEGRVLSLYRWRWAIGPAYDGEHAEYREVWSAADTLDEGWLETGDGRRFRLVLLIPGPEIQEYTFDRVEALPPELRRSASVRVSGMYHCEPHPTEDRGLLTEIDDPAIGITQSIGEEPVAWVKWLLDR